MSGSLSAAKSPDDAYLEILKEKGLEHERLYFERLKSEGKSSIEIERDESTTIEDMAERTRQAMRDGIDVIFQGALTAPGWHGYSDFLLKVDTPSDFGPWSYEVADTKLARTAKPKHVVQLCLYSEIIAREQVIRPEHAHVVLGDGIEFKVRLHDYLYYCNHTQERFNQFVSGDERDTVAERCPHCGLCRWSEKCDEEWERDGNLRLVAGLGASQAEKLRAEGITSIDELAKLLDDDVRIPRIQASTLERLRCRQAVVDYTRSIVLLFEHWRRAASHSRFTWGSGSTQTS